MSALKPDFNPKAFESMKPGKAPTLSPTVPKPTHGGVARQPVENRRGLLARALRGNKSSNDQNLPKPTDFSGP